MPFHLFPYGSAGRPYANKKMRELFGPMCDAPTPREYIDSFTGESGINTIVTAMKQGVDLTTIVTCRMLGNRKPRTKMHIIHLHSYKNPEQIKFT